MANGVDLLSTAVEKKAGGNKLFKNGEYFKAIVKYSAALKVLGEVDSMPKELKKEAARILGNRCECRLKLKREYEKALKDAEASLKLDPGFTKGFYRRGRVFLALKRLTEAMRDFQITVRDDPDNALALASWKLTKHRLEKEGDREHAYHKAASKLKSGAPTPPDETITLIDTVLAQVIHADTYHRNIVDLRFTQSLATRVISESQPMKVRSKAMRGLILCLREFTIEDFNTENVRLKEDAFLTVIPQVLLLFSELAPRSDDMDDEDDPKDLLEAMAHFLGRAIGDTELEQFREQAIQLMGELFHRLDAQSMAHHRVIQNICHAFCVGALAGGEVLELLRKHTTAHLLFSEFSQSSAEATRAAVVRVIAIMSGKKGVDDEIRDSKRSDKATAYITKVRQMVRVAVLGSSKKNRQMGMRALALVVQGDHKNGCNIAATSKVLTALMTAATEPDEYLLNERAAEALALCCGQTEVHQAIIGAGKQDIFVWLLETKDKLVRAHSCLALAKFAALDKDAKELAHARGNRTLLAIMDILKAHPPKAEAARGPFGQFMNIKELEQNENLQERSSPLYVSVAIEALSYLMLHVETKLALVAQKNKGKYMKALIEHAKSRNRSDRHGVLMILLNASLSAGDRKTEFTKTAQALKELKKTVSQGMPYDLSAEEERIASLSGTEEQIQKVRERLIDLGGIEAIYECMRRQRKENERLKDASERDDLQIEHGLSLNVKLMEVIAQALVNCTILKEHRGKMASQGAIRLLLDVHKTKSDKARVWSATAIARIAISTNPALFNSNEVPVICRTLVSLITESKTELQAYEALLALTNLASLNDDTRETILKAGAWDDSQKCFNHQSELSHQAALELEQNLLQHEDGVELCITQPEADLKVFILFCKSTTPKIVQAATACLASVCWDEDCAKVFARLGGVPVMTVLANGDDPIVKERVRIALGQMKENGFTMSNFAEHNLDKEFFESMQKEETEDEDEEEEEKNQPGADAGLSPKE